MATSCIPQLAFSFHGTRQRVVASFDAEHATSDGGLPLLKALDEGLGLTERLAGCLDDPRHPSRIRHSVHEILRQRIYGLALGYEDANDSARLAHDPVHKLAIDRDPIDGAALAAQPTLSRFENAATRKDLYRMGEALADTVIETERRRRRRRRPKVITIDLDPTDDPTHGQQQLSFFHGHYGNWCYLPLIATLSFDDEGDPLLVAAVLRPGNVGPSRGAIGLLRRLIGKLRLAFSGARLRVRVDGGFTEPALFTFLEEQRIEYVIGIPHNPKLNRLAAEMLDEAAERSARSGDPEQVWGEIQYRTKRWKRDRRIVIKAEVTRLAGREPRCNPRYVVTNLSGKPERVYEIYRWRGEQENRIKELKLDLALGRTSCTRFLANQLRVLMTAAAYVLMQQLRRAARGTSCARAHVSTLRLRLLKMAAWIQRSVRRIVLHLPASAPWRDDWCRVARRLGAVPP